MAKSSCDTQSKGIFKVILVGLEGRTQQFEDKLYNLTKTSLDKNSDWFKPLLEQYTNYDEWSLLIKDNEIVAFAAIQSHNFPDNHCRLLTRTYYDPDIRNKYMGYPPHVTPAMIIVKHQLSVTKNKIRFISMEWPWKKHLLTSVGNKINKLNGTNFKLQEKLYNTVPNCNKPNSWQNIISERDIILESITRSEWQDRFPNAKRKSNKTN